MTILGISGHKSAGKNTSANFIIGSFMGALGIVQGGFSIDSQGRLWVTDIFGDQSFKGIFDVNRNNDTMRDFKQKYLDQYVRLYSYADKLKEFCIDVLGLTWEQCYGTNNDKDSATNIKWENLPYASGLTGFMSAREVLQEFGTNICRKMYPDVWVDATIRQIKKDNPVLAIIADVRFPNEVVGIQKTGGKVIRFTRQVYSDMHFSEIALDGYTAFDAIVDNSKDSIDEQNDKVYKILSEWELIPDVEWFGEENEKNS